MTNIKPVQYTFNRHITFKRANNIHVMVKNATACVTSEGNQLLNVTALGRSGRRASCSSTFSWPSDLDAIHSMYLLLFGMDQERKRRRQCWHTRTEAPAASVAIYFHELSGFLFSLIRVYYRHQSSYHHIIESKQVIRISLLPKIMNLKYCIPIHHNECLVY